MAQVYYGKRWVVPTAHHPLCSPPTRENGVPVTQKLRGEIVGQLEGIPGSLIRFMKTQARDRVVPTLAREAAPSWGNQA
jgi:hypothetical protein